MRQLLIQVPSGEGKTVLQIAQDRGGVNLLLFDAQSDRSPHLQHSSRA